MKKIFICPDNSIGAGLGHITRSRALFDCLSEDFDVVFKPLKFNERIDIADINCDLIIIDSHLEIGEALDHLKKKNIKTIVLDNFNKDSRVLGLNIYDHFEVDRAKTITSLDHIILRKEIFVKKKDSCDHENYALVTIGGEDVLREGSKIVDCLLQQYTKKIILILGLKSPEVNIQHPRVEILRAPDSFLDILSKAEVVLCNSGSTLFESLYLGRRCITFPQSNYERNISQYFLEKNLVLGIGIDSIDFSLKKLNEFAVVDIPFDGRGANAIKDRIKEIL